MQSAIGSSSRIRNGPLRKVWKAERISAVHISFFYNIPHLQKYKLKTCPEAIFHAENIFFPVRETFLS